MALRATPLTTNPVDDYAEAVVSGVLPAGKYHRLACARHLRDRAREGQPDFPYVFELARAERFFQFAGLLKHYKGKQWAMKPITLTPVQKFRLGSVFGWVHRETGLRRFTRAYNELPRKSGKTLEAAVVAVYVTFFDGEPGAEGYCIATKRAQARLVFDAARALVVKSGLRTRVAVRAHNLHRTQWDQKLEPLGADADSTDGLNPYLIITDEFHAHKRRDLVDVMESATGARLSFLHFIITTAGDDPVSPCGDEHDYACQILDQVLQDEATEATFAFIAHADPDDDWLDEKTWQKANPHYGISVNPEDIRKLALKAKAMPSAAAEFKQKRLNLWVNTQQPWLSMDGWRAGQTEWTAEEMRGQTCYVGIDLASKLDLTALSYVFPPAGDRKSWRWLQVIWTPEATLKDRARRDRAPYLVWEEKKRLNTVPGTEMDYAVIRAELVSKRSMFRIEQIGLDPWHSDKLGKELITVDGFSETQVINVAQTYAGMSSAAKGVEGQVLAGLLDAGGCPVSAWAASNAVVQKDGKDNIYPVKKRSRGRIDPLMSGIIGESLALRNLVTTPSYQMMVVGKGGLLQMVGPQ